MEALVLFIYVWTRTQSNPWLHKVKRIYYVKNIYVRQITLEFSFCLLLVVNVCDSMSCYVPQ